jgi:hypothetical protein
VDGKVACDSKAGYGESPLYISGGGAMASAPAAPAAPGAPGTSPAAPGHGHGGAGKPHISSMVLCWKDKNELKVRQIKAGQTWTVEAQYDYKQFTGATHPDGKQENVMGIGVVWVKKSKVA